MNKKDEPDFVALIGGDARVVPLIEIALSAYSWLPLSLRDRKTFTPTRDKIAAAIEAFGLTPARIPWERLPKRFHRNKPELVILRPGVDAEAYIENLILANADKPPKPKPPKAGKKRVREKET